VKVVLLYVLPLALMMYALIDCGQDNDVERTSVPKVLWIVLIVIFPYFGAIAWIVISKFARPRGPRPSPPPRGPFPPGTPRRRTAPLAPDDDPEFLRRLDERTRRERGPDAPEPPAPAPEH
jgi:hypothetical protein